MILELERKRTDKRMSKQIPIFDMRPKVQGINAIYFWTLSYLLFDVIEERKNYTTTTVTTFLHITSQNRFLHTFYCAFIKFRKSN